VVETTVWKTPPHAGAKPIHMVATTGAGAQKDFAA